MSVEQNCPVCTSSESAKEQSATAKVAVHCREKARHEPEHQEWIDNHAENGTLAEIRAALCEESPS